MLIPIYLYIYIHIYIYTYIQGALRNRSEDSLSILASYVLAMLFCVRGFRVPGLGFRVLGLGFVVVHTLCVQGLLSS